MQKQRKKIEELNISHHIGTKLGPNPDNEINTIEFFKTIKNTKFHIADNIPIAMYLIHTIIFNSKL